MTGPLKKELKIEVQPRSSSIEDFSLVSPTRDLGGIDTQVIPFEMKQFRTLIQNTYTDYFGFELTESKKFNPEDYI